MRRFDRLQRGSTNWPFIIVLLALLVFVYLWWSESQKVGQEAENLTKANERAVAAEGMARERGEVLNEVRRVIGYGDAQMPRGSFDSSQEVYRPDLASLSNDIDPAGETAGAEGAEPVKSTIRTMLDAARIRVPKQFRSGDADSGARVEEFSAAIIPEDIKSKIADILAMDAPVKPTMPADAGDTDAQEEYERALREYDEKIAELNSALEGVSDNAKYEQFKAALRWELGGLVDGDAEFLELVFLTQPEQKTVEKTLAAVRDMPAKFVREYEAMKLADEERIRGLVAERDALNQSLADKQTELDAANANYASTVSEKDREINELNDRLAAAQQAATDAKNALEKAKGDFETESARARAALANETEARRQMKELIDLKIRRDDKDGEILMANRLLGTATIDLGFADKVYVGQVFGVRARNRVGDRVAKGKVKVIRATGAHSAKVRIIEGSASQGDEIHNPLYEAGANTNVFFAASLLKWSTPMAKDRLALKNVTLQSAVDGNTDYIVVPDSWTRAAPVNEDDEEAEVGAKTPYERMKDLARESGAKVISERQLDSWLDY